uniref:Uncharacterized protein n=1 Tax=Pan paniscus TaxID=9597 RepID=A0A2R8ZNQ2_PANPA
MERDPVARPPGASRSQTPNYKEQREGGAVLATAALGTEADDASAGGLWELQVEQAELRPECSRLCFCPFLPAHPLHISTYLCIIQHPVQLKTSISSQYVIRMRPINRCLSTLECAPVALSILEKNNYIQETLLHPLEQHLLKNGLYPKPMPKNKHKLRKMKLLKNSVKI